jgi:hypothetical protein
MKLESVLLSSGALRPRSCDSGQWPSAPFFSAFIPWEEGQERRKENDLPTFFWFWERVTSLPLLLLLLRRQSHPALQILTHKEDYLISFLFFSSSCVWKWSLWLHSKCELWMSILMKCLHSLFICSKRLNNAS